MINRFFVTLILVASGPVTLTSCDHREPDSIDTNSAKEKETGERATLYAREKESEYYCARAKNRIIIKSVSLGEKVTIKKYSNDLVLPWAFVQRTHTKEKKLPEYTAAISHEIGHLLLSARVKKRMENEHTYQYGTVLPDWLDELAAVAFEDKATKRRRKDEYIELSKLDLLYSAPCFFDIERGVDLNKTLHCKKKWSEKIYYPQTMALLDFLSETNGKKCLLKKLLAGKIKGLNKSSQLPQVIYPTPKFLNDFTQWINEQAVSNKE